MNIQIQQLKPQQDFPTNLKYQYYILSQYFPNQLTIKSKHLQPYQSRVQNNLEIVENDDNQIPEQQQENEQLSTITESQIINRSNSFMDFINHKQQQLNNHDTIEKFAKYEPQKQSSSTKLNFLQQYCYKWIQGMDIPKTNIQTTDLFSNKKKQQVLKDANKKQQKFLKKQQIQSFNKQKSICQSNSNKLQVQKGNNKSYFNQSPNQLLKKPLATNNPFEFRNPQGTTKIQQNYHLFSNSNNSHQQTQYFQFQKPKQSTTQINKQPKQQQVYLNNNVQQKSSQSKQQINSIKKQLAQLSKRYNSIAQIVVNQSKKITTLQNNNVLLTKTNEQLKKELFEMKKCYGRIESIEINLTKIMSIYEQKLQ